MDRRGYAQFSGDGIRGGRWWLEKFCRGLRFLGRRPWWASSVGNWGYAMRFQWYWLYPPRGDVANMKEDGEEMLSSSSGNCQEEKEP